MELTSKQRAQLRGLANSLDVIVHIGKDGISENLVKQADEALVTNDGTEIVAAGGASVEDSVITGTMNYFVAGVEVA